MLVVLSPAKDLNFDTSGTDPRTFTQPRLGADLAELAEVTKGLTRQDLRDLMGISDKLADLNYLRFQALAPSQTSMDGRMAAALAFAGDVYRGLDARSFDQDALAFAQEHLRHLSGLYGLLRPLDAIAPYRLEMGTRLRTDRGATLYAFWGARIAEAINADLDGHNHRVLVNLASEEYAKAIDRSALDARVVTVSFKDIKDGKARSLFMYVKRARGLMARWIIENRITNPDALQDFAVDGYALHQDASKPEALIFTRPQPAKKAA